MLEFLRFFINFSIQTFKNFALTINKILKIKIFHFLCILFNFLCLVFDVLNLSDLICYYVTQHYQSQVDNQQLKLKIQRKIYKVNKQIAGGNNLKAMLSKLINHYFPKYLFSRKNKISIDPQELKQVQHIVLQKLDKRGYLWPQLFKHQDILYQQELYGNKSQISGITQNNEQSSIFTNQVIQLSRPDLIIMGGLNEAQALYFMHQKMNKFSNLQLLAANKLYCKSTLLPVIQNRLSSDVYWFNDEKNKMIFKIDHLGRTINLNDYINAAFYSQFIDAKLMYGKPSALIIFQDLMLTLSLQELEEMLETTINQQKENHLNECQASVTAVEEQLRTYAMYHQPKLYTKQITYTTALLNRVTKISSKNLLLIPNCFVQKVAEQVHKIDFQPESIYRKWIDDPNSENYAKYQQIIADNKVEQLLKKFVILGILKGFHLEQCLYDGKNIFKNSVFKQILGQYTSEDIISMFKPYKILYYNKVCDIMRRRTKNKLSFHPPQTRFMNMQHQFKTLQERKQMFLYEFRPKNYITERQNAQKIQILHKKIDEIVLLQCDDYEKKLMEAYKGGERTKQNIILYAKLVGKANAQLKERVKLPYFHFNAFRGFYKEYLKQHILFDEDKKITKMELKKLKKIDEKFQKLVKQVKDPYELRKYVTGQKGKVKQINYFQGENGQFDIEGELQDLQKMAEQMGNQQMIKDIQQLLKEVPKTNQEDEFSEDKQFQKDYDDTLEQMDKKEQNSNKNKNKKFK